MIKIDKEAFYTTKDLVPILNKTQVCIERYCKNGLLKAVKPNGREWIVKGSEVIEFLGKNKPKKQ